MPDADVRILYVEDDNLNRALLRATLMRASDARLSSAVIDDAGSLAEARRALERHDYDVVLLDRRLPDGDGFRLASELRAAPSPTRPTVVALTADAVPATRQAALEAGCDAIVIKPYAPAELLELLGQELSKRAAA